MVFLYLLYIYTMLEKDILVCTPTISKNTSIWKFNKNIFGNYNKDKIDYIVWHNISWLPNNKLIFKILKYLRLKDFIASYLFYKKHYLDNRYKTIFNDTMQWWWAIKLDKDNKNVLKISLFRASIMNAYEWYIKLWWFKNTLIALFYKYIIWFFERISLKYSDKIIVVSDQWKMHFMKYYWVTENKITVINNAIETDIFKPSSISKSECKNKLWLDKNDFHLIFVWRFTFEKWKDIIKKVMDKINIIDNRIKLLLIDDYGTSDELPDNIIYIWKKQNTELPLRYNAADLLFFPSIYEWDSLTILESAASWCPIIWSDTWWLWWLKRNNKIIWEYVYKIGNNSEIIDWYVKWIIRLLNNQKEYKKLKSEYLARWRKKHIKENINIYKKAIFYEQIN